MLGLGLGLNRGVNTYGIAQYLGDLPSFAQSSYSLAFDAEGAENLNDYEANTLYFRDSDFNRVAATFSRSTTATYIDRNGVRQTAAANVPRIDYSDGSAKLLMEPSRTNLFLNSGTPATQTITVVNGTIYTVWIEGSGSIVLSGADTGTVTEGSEVTFTASSTSLTCTVSGSVDIAQVEEGSYPTSYIPTAGSAVTRNGDSVSLASLTSSGYITATEFTLYADLTRTADTTLSTISSTDRLMGTFSDDYLAIYGNTGRPYAPISPFYLSASSGQKYLYRNTSTLDFDAYVDGSAGGTTLTIVDRVNSISIGNSGLRQVFNFSNYILFPTALTDSECETLTS